jgi:mitochondrial fission protein ELM1
VHGENVLLVETALHRVTPDALSEAKIRFAPAFANLPSPRLGVLLGGRTKNGGFRTSDVEALLSGLDAHLGQGGSVLITPSRRTEPHVTAALRERYEEDARVFLWDGSGENPYFGILAFADHMLVTADSVSMVSEAIGTELPVDVFPLEGLGRRHKLLLDRLEELGHVGRFGAPEPTHRPAPLPSATLVAAERVKMMLAARSRD